MQSYVFDFEKSPTFFQKWNKEFDVEDIGTNCFYFVLVDDICYDNFEECVDSEGHLKYDQSHWLYEECYLEYTESENQDAIELTIDGTVTIDFEDLSIDDFDMKGCFILTDSEYVVGYSINTRSLNISNKFIIEDGLKLFTIGRKLYGE